MPEHHSREPPYCTAVRRSLRTSLQWCAGTPVHATTPLCRRWYGNGAGFGINVADFFEARNDFRVCNTALSSGVVVALPRHGWGFASRYQFWRCVASACQILQSCSTGPAYGRRATIATAVSMVASLAAATARGLGSHATPPRRPLERAATIRASLLCLLL